VIIFGTVVSNNINSRREKTCTIELKDPHYITPSTQRLVVEGEYRLGSEVEITIEERL
jgi:hypothetical protein